MKTTTTRIGLLLAAALPGLLHAQFNFTIGGRDVQIHSFASQGFAYLNDNHYLTMNTSQGSFARVDLNSHWNVKVGGHFMDGYGSPGMYADGFYTQDNAQGLKPKTNLLIVRTGFNF